MGQGYNYPAVPFSNRIGGRGGISESTVQVVQGGMGIKNIKVNSQKPSLRSGLLVPFRTTLCCNLCSNWNAAGAGRKYSK